MSELVSAMLQAGGGKASKSKGPLIEDLSERNLVADTPAAPPAASPNEGPSMLEMMMAAQAAAKKDKAAVAQVEEKKATKSFGTGFKKGFLGGSSKADPVKKPPKVAADSAIPTVKSSGKQGGSVVASSIAQEVQENMKKDANPMMQKLQGGEWVTPDLVQVMQSNSILASGLQNPKCMAALQLMQKSPAEAKQRFGDDPDVNAFVLEFGRVMGDHFTSLGEKETKSAPASTGENAPKGPMISEVTPGTRSSTGSMGLLYEAALDRQRKQPLNVSSSEVSDKQVEEVLKDDDLRAMLQDPKMQEILVECGNPAKFQLHMRNPDTAKKIQRLYKAGLVGTVK